MMGGCLSVYEGILHFSTPYTGESAFWSYVVLGVSLLFTPVSAAASYKVFNAQRAANGFWEAVRTSKDPTVFIVLLSDLGDLVCLLIAFAGVFLGHLFHSANYDGFASVLIGLVLIGISLLLARESRSLLMGEPIQQRTMREVAAMAEADEAILNIKEQLSQYLGPEEIVLQMQAVFKPDLTTEQITDAISRAIARIQQRFPRLKQIFIEPVKDT